MIKSAVVAVDVGGTFTDVVVEIGDTRTTGKVLTDVVAPERGVLRGVHETLQRSGLALAEVRLFLHGTTLATNALIERKGAKTALVTTQGFRDGIEIGYENRFDQYDLQIRKAPPLVPRHLRFTVTERMLAGGKVDTKLDEAELSGLARKLADKGIESVAVGFLHSYANPSHERLARDILKREMSGIDITLSSEVCPEIREYERFTTATANAYVQPLMRGYLTALERDLVAEGLDAPVLLMTSAGGLTTVKTACDYPIRLVESGPAGGAMLASRFATEMKLGDILSFDMGGTTAKICMIDDATPQTSRAFEVDRRYNYMKGSGLPLRIPVIDMVEIGAGGGSIATLDAMGRLKVGPESSGSTPGPACYGRGGTHPTVTDANLVLGRINPDTFAGGTIVLDAGAARKAASADLGDALGLSAEAACQGIAEMVEENMANAARRHAVESGKGLGHRTLIAFGGSAPLHAARLAAKLGISRIVVPPHAGVGSAVGFLCAPVSFDLVRSQVSALSATSPETLDTMLDGMVQEALSVVAKGAPGQPTSESAMANMRYAGQGHEIEIALPPRPFAADTAATLRALFEERYAALFGHVIEGQEIEFVDFSVRVWADRPDAGSWRQSPDEAHEAQAVAQRAIFDPQTGRTVSVPVYDRASLKPGARMTGPCVIAEAETTTVVTRGFEAAMDGIGAIVLTAKPN